MLSILAVLSAATGVVLVWFVLRTFFSITVSLLTIGFIVFGTNYFWWIFFDGATPHNFLFTCFAAVILFTIKWHREQKWTWIFLIFCFTILACFIHALSALILIFPVLLGVHDRTSWSDRLGQIRKNPGQYFLLLLTLITVILLTRFKWFAEPGTVFYYGDPEAAVYPFLASSAHLILWSFKKGWLIYTPMMLLAIPGMYFLADRKRELFYAVFFFFLFWFLLASSNKGWADDPGFGQRFFIETYAVLALPLGFFIDRIFTDGKRFSKVILILPVLFLILNLFQTWQFSAKILIPEKMNREAYCAIFGKKRLSPEAAALLDTGFDIQEEKIPETVKFRVTRIESYGFESPGPPEHQSFYDSGHAHTGKSSWRHTKEKPFSPGMTRTIGSFPRTDSAWLRVSGWFYFDCPAEENKVALVATCNHNGFTYNYFSKTLTRSFLPREWNYVAMDYLLPQYFLGKTDLVQVYFWNYGNQINYLDDIRIDLYEPIKE